MITEVLELIFFPVHLLVCFFGTAIGMLVGALPGLGAVVAITICLPFTFGMSTSAAIALLMGVYCGSICGGSIASILVNTPGTPASAATSIDGYAMARKGLPGEALGWAIASSLFGGLFSCVILAVATPQVAALALEFGPLETTLLIFFGLTCIINVSSGNQVKGLASAFLGLLMASVGISPIYGDARLTFSLFELNSGLDLIAVIVGIFALGEVLMRSEMMLRQKRVESVSCHVRLPKISQWKGHLVCLIKSSLIGTIVGVLPGAGAATAAFISYGEAKRSSSRKEALGKGEPDGIIAPEAANNAVTGGAMIPALALGIPGDAVTAVMLATFVLHGVTPGVRLMTDNSTIVYATFGLMALSSIFMYPCFVVCTRLFKGLMRLPEPLFLSLILVLCLIGSYGSRGNGFDVLVTCVFGVLGYLMCRTEFPTAPLVIALVLGRQFEVGLIHTIFYKGDLGWFEFITSSSIGTVLAIMILLVQLYPIILRFCTKQRHENPKFNLLDQEIVQEEKAS